jgi:hypothetical protein
MPANQPIVPREYAGKWIAWDHDRTQIIASGSTPSEAVELAKSRGCLNPLLEKVPRKNLPFTGGPRRLERKS